jgi:hypothetical protein
MKIDTLKLVYFDYFHSIMSYGVIFWGNSADSKRTPKRKSLEYWQVLKQDWKSVFFGAH